jgi:3-hydroxybutyryl-CoA dehydrogenase
MNKIQKVGIIGSGKMGSDIFNYLSDYSFDLVWYTIETDQIKSLQESLEKKNKRQLKHGIINQEIFEQKSNYKITNQLTDLSDCDLVIESVIEDQSVKTEVFRKLENIVKPSCLLVSNSSSILPSQYSQDLLRKNRVAGIHFFYPLAIKNITELIFSDDTDEITRESLRLFLETINRFYIEQDEKNAFILNRFLLEIQVKANELIRYYNLGFKQIDEIAKRIIPDFGLFEMMDHVGHNTMYNSILNYSLMDREKRKYQPLLDELVKRKDNTDSSNHLFYERDSLTNIDPEKEEIIYITLKDFSMKIFTEYSNTFAINIYTFKKALHEFCGIMV